MTGCELESSSASTAALCNPFFKSGPNPRHLLFIFVPLTMHWQKIDFKFDCIKWKKPKWCNWDRDSNPWSQDDIRTNLLRPPTVIVNTFRSTFKQRDSNPTHSVRRYLQNNKSIKWFDQNFALPSNKIARKCVVWELVVWLTDLLTATPKPKPSVDGKSSFLSN